MIFQAIFTFNFHTEMSCPFVQRKPVETLNRQQSSIHDFDLQEASDDDSLTLKHINSALQLLTGNYNSSCLYIHQAIFVLQHPQIKPSTKLSFH